MMQDLESDVLKCYINKAIIKCCSINTVDPKSVHLGAKSYNFMYIVILKNQIFVMTI